MMAGTKSIWLLKTLDKHMALDYFETSLVVRLDYSHVVFIYCCQPVVLIFQLDVENTFLHCDFETIYMEQPSE